MGNFHSGPEARPGYSSVNVLRSNAEQHKKQRNECYERSQNAYAAGDHAAAKHYSLQGKEHDKKLKELNARAAEDIFRLNNASRDEGMIDLHGLKVKEAIDRVEQVLQAAKNQNKKQVVFIVGKGLHSPDGVPVLRPAIESLINKHNLRCIPGRPNQGCLLVQFVDKQQRGWVEQLLGCIIS